MNVHFMTDSVYSKRFIEINNKIDKESIYIVLDDKIKYLNNDNIIYIPLLNEYSYRKHPILFFRNFLILLKYIKKSERIFFHLLSDIYLYILLFFCKKQKTFWLVWGSDLYSRITYEFYDSNTLSFFPACKDCYKKKSIKHKIETIIISKAIKKISYIGNVVEGDYKLISDNFGVLNNRIDFFYPNPLKFDNYASLNNSEKKSITILLGNSGDPTNNHISVIDKMKKMKNIKVICPLSYGNKSYINKLTDYGKMALGESFIAITEFLSEDKYLDLLDTIDVAIMNHYRQQALGNISALLLLGKNVFVNSKSPVYDFFIKKGVIINDTNEFLKDSFCDFSFYDDETIKNNREIIKNLTSEEKSISYIKNLYF